MKAFFEGFTSRFDSKPGKLVASAAVLMASTLTAITIGAYADFTSGVTGSTPVTTGTVALTIGATNSVTNRLEVAAVDVMPGDSIERVVDVTNAGSLNLTAVTMSTTASGSTLLSTDTTNGLQLQIQTCDVAWTETSNAPRSGYSYTCSGSLNQIATSSPLVNASRNLGSKILVAGATEHYMIKMTLPATAGNTFQNLSTVVTHTFGTTTPGSGNR